MKRLTVLAAMVGLMVGVLYIGGAEAYDEIQLLRCKTSKGCSGYDLSRADLRGAYLIGADLNRADLREAYLRVTNLTGANLSQAHLNGANLSNATWTDGSKCKDGSVGECKK